MVDALVLAGAKSGGKTKVALRLTLDRGEQQAYKVRVTGRSSKPAVLSHH